MLEHDRLALHGKGAEQHRKAFAQVAAALDDCVAGQIETAAWGEAAEGRCGARRLGCAVVHVGPIR